MKYIKTYETKNIEQKKIYVKLLNHLISFFKKLGYTSKTFSNTDGRFQDRLLMTKSVEFKLNDKYIFSIFLKETVAGNYYFRYTRTHAKIEDKILDNFMDFMESIDGIDVNIKRNEEFYFGIENYDNIEEIINKINIEYLEQFIKMKKFNL